MLVNWDEKNARAYIDVLCRYSRTLIFDDNHGPTDASAVTSDMDCTVVMVDVHTDELAEPASSTETAEIVYESIRESSEAYNGTVDIDDEGIWRIDFGTSGLTDV